MNIIANKGYPFKVWASTMLTAPLILGIWEMVISADSGGAFGFLFFIIFFGAMLSFPSFLVCHFAFIALAKRVRSAFHLKLVFIGMAIFCLVASIIIVFGRRTYNVFMDYAGLTFSGIYALPVVVFGLLFKAAKEEPELEDDFLKDLNTEE